MASITATEVLVVRPTGQSEAKVADSQTLHDSIIAAGSEAPVSSEPSGRPLRSTSTLRVILAVFQLCMVNFLSSFTSGIITVGLPTIARSISLPRSLYLWPASVYGLTTGATLLLAGSIADLIGARHVDLFGCLLLSVFTLACGFARTGIQLVIFRALQGIAMSMHLPASVALVAAAVPRGKSRNVSFGCLGLSQPLGFSAGMVISGIMIEKAGWRSGFYLSGGAIFVATIAGVWSLPKAPLAAPVAEGEARASKLLRIWREIDWTGGIIASAGLALLAYVLGILSADLSAIHKPTTAILLTLSLVLLLAFPLWMHQRESSGKPALIPNIIWKKVPFTSTCIMVALSYGVMNSMELFSSLYFQEIQNTSAFFTSLRLLPSLLVGAAINLSVGLFVDKVPARWLVAGSSMLCAVAPLLMALVNPKWSYWYMEFWAQIFSPMSGDVLFTVGLLIVSDEFPEQMQALAGAVFNTVAQFGMSLGMGVCQVVALGVSGTEEHDSSVNTRSTKDSNSEGQSLQGYQASFWTMFAIMVTCTMIALGGLRKAGRVGVKRE
jgi:MFS family permease